jgi:hypothetical protein
MTDIVLPPDLVDLQRAVYTAEAAVEAHRRGVDVRRRAEAVVVTDAPKWMSPTLPPWSPVEDAEHDRLMAGVRAAAEARRAGLLASGLGESYDVVQALHREARAV